MSTHDTLDEMLNAEKPRVSSPSPLGIAAIRQMAQDAQRQARPRRRRPVAASLAVLLILGGGSTAAAAATWQWHLWAQEPDASFIAIMPSGDTCEYRVGGVQGASSEVNEAVRAFVAENDILALADVDSAIAQARSDGQMTYDENGELQLSGPGTAHYNADFEYQSALNLAVAELVTEHLRAQGMLAPYSLDMQARCGGE